MSEPRPKIIVDDDWKTRVQKEKETGVQPQQSEPVAKAPEQKQPSGASSAEAPLPPPSFTLLLGSLATEALVGLGQIPGPDDQAPAVNLPHAKHFIDMLAVLEEKTKGNLNQEEAAMLENVLHELRMAFVAVSTRR